MDVRSTDGVPGLPLAVSPCCQSVFPACPSGLHCATQPDGARWAACMHANNDSNNQCESGVSSHGCGQARPRDKQTGMCTSGLAANAASSRDCAPAGGPSLDGSTGWACSPACCQSSGGGRLLRLDKRAVKQPGPGPESGSRHLGCLLPRCCGFPVCGGALMSWWGGW